MLSVGFAMMNKRYHSAGQKVLQTMPLCGRTLSVDTMAGVKQR